MLGTDEIYRDISKTFEWFENVPRLKVLQQYMKDKSWNLFCPLFLAAGISPLVLLSSSNLNHYKSSSKSVVEVRSLSPLTLLH